MKTHSITLLMSALLGSAVGLAPGCKKQTAVAPEFVAQVGEAVITRAAFEAELAERARAGQRLATPAQREAVLQEMIRLEVFYAKARAAGLDKDPAMVSQFKRMLAGKIEEAEWSKMPAPAKPDLAEIELYYQGRLEEFTTPEKIQVAILHSKVPGKAGVEQAAAAEQKVKQWREQAVAQAAQQPHFGLLAQKHSDDLATRYQGGDCGWIARNSKKYNWDATLVEALFALQNPGEITPLIRTTDGFYLGKLIGRKSAEVAPLAAVRDRIEHKLIAQAQQQARQRFETAQRAGVAVKINETVVAAIAPPPLLAETSQAQPPSLPQ